MPRERARAAISDDQCAVKVGQLVGNYRLEQVIGRGGMGVVFRAVHKDIARKAAVKVLDRDFSRDPEFVTRFLNEARAVNLVGHPGLVEIFEFGCLPDETPYIIMEFLEGESLAKRLKANGGRLGASAINLGRQVASALAAAHAQGIVHREQYNLKLPSRKGSSDRSLETFWKSKPRTSYASFPESMRSSSASSWGERARSCCRSEGGSAGVGSEASALATRRKAVFLRVSGST